MRTRSIRSYLLWRLLGGSALVLAAAGAAVYAVVTRSLAVQFDRNLADRVQALASILFQVEDHVEFEFSDELMPEYDREERPAYFEIRFDDGSLLEGSNSLAGEALDVPGAPTPEPSFRTAPLPDGRTGRYVDQLVTVHHVYPEEGPDAATPATVRIAVARGREELLAAEREVLAGCVAVFLVLMALIGALTWTAVQRGLAPARRLAARLDALRPDDLPPSLGIGDLPAELEPVGDKLEALVRRVDVALERERRTTADIAHELRTPLSEMLTVAEVALRNGRDPDDARRALGTVRDTSWRMGRSVATLLKLARLEMGTETFAREDVDLAELVGETLRSLAPVQRERELRVERGLDGETRVEGDPDVLRIVVSNLLSNAVHYAPRGGLVGCRLEREGGAWRLLVENDAPHLSDGDLRRVAEPFWRKDRARAERERSGLGLALSCALAERTGLALGFELAAGRFRASLAPRDRVGAGA